MKKSTKNKNFKSLEAVERERERATVYKQVGSKINFERDIRQKEKKREKFKQKRLKDAGITLIALVITVIVILLLAGVSISMISGDDGILKRAGETTFKTEISAISEELEMYKTQKLMEDSNFVEDSLSANNEEGSLYYNTKPDDETGDISTILPSANKKYLENIEIINGQMVYATTDMTELSWLEDLGVGRNPYNITEDGTLISSESNLNLMDSTGTLILPSSITKIGCGAVSNLEGLTRVIIPGSVKEIGENAFSNNSEIETVIMEDGVEIIGNSAFFQCSRLTTIEIPNSVISIGESAFYGDSSLSNIELPNKLTKISDYCFAYCSFKEIYIPEGVETIGDNAFLYCGELTKINIPSSVKTIENSAFVRCPNLTTIESAEENTNFEFRNGVLLGNAGKEMIIILENAINGDTFTVPTGVTTLQDNMLSSFSNVTTLEIPETVTSISASFINGNITNIIIDSNNKQYMTDGKAIYTKNGKTLVRYYADDTEIVIDEGVEIVANRAFSQRAKCTSITLPDSLKQIDGYAFQLCDKLQSISLGSKVEKLDSLFIYNSYIKEISIDEKNTNFLIRDGALYNYDGTVFINPIKPSGTITSYEIPYGVTEIGGNAFNNQYNMTSVTIPNTVTKIGSSFNFCTKLTKVEIPSSVTTISDNCFNLCSNLSEIIIHKPQGSIEDAPWRAPKGDRVLNWVGE